MAKGEEKLWHSDVVVFEGENLVVYYKQIIVYSFHPTLREPCAYFVIPLSSRCAAPSSQGHTIKS